MEAMSWNQVVLLSLSLFNSFSNELFNSLFCFLRENQTRTVAYFSVLACSLPDSEVGWSKPPSVVIALHPELRCPVFPSENEEVDRKAHFLELPTGHQFPFKGTQDRE